MSDELFINCAYSSQNPLTFTQLWNVNFFDDWNILFEDTHIYVI